jgi:phage-related minor tail protein
VPLTRLFSTEVQYAIVGIAGAITAALIPALWGIAKNALLAAAPFTPLIIAGAAVAALAFTIYKNWEPIKNFFVNTWQGIKDTVVTTIENVKTKISEMIQAGKDFVMRPMGRYFKLYD